MPASRSIGSLRAPDSGTPGAVPDAPRTDGLPPAVAVSPEERRALLDLARAAIASAAGGSHGAVVPALDSLAAAGRRAAAFVTLTEDGELRGCMGILDPDRSMAEAVLEAAECAARWDPRFPGVRAPELDRIEVEVSILGPLVRLADPRGFRLGVDGVVVERDGRRGLLLPEVAAMLGFDRVEMLDTACRKAGLPADAWRDPGTTVYAFRTTRFGGPAVAPA